MACPKIPADCVADVAGGLAGNIAGGVASSAWESVCKSFAEAATTLLKAFAKAFAAFPDVNPLSEGVRGVYAISLGIAIVVGGALFLWQVARTVITHEGAPLAYAVVGLGKALLAFVATLTVTSAAVMASNDLTDWIINASFGNMAGLQDKIATIFTFETSGQTMSLILIMALIGIALTLVLWAEVLLSSAAVAVLIGTSPIAAAGHISETTKAWWPKLGSATAQLIMLKPVIALVFSVGFGITGDADDLGTLLAGMVILLLSVLAWPAIARFFTFAQVSVGGGSGLASLLGVAAGRSSEAMGATGGVAPDQFGRSSEDRTMSAVQARSRNHHAGTASKGAAAAAGGVPLALASAGLGLAQRAANSLVGRMEQTASHAGLDRPNPHPGVAGQPGYPTRWPSAQHGSEDPGWMNTSDTGDENSIGDGNSLESPGPDTPGGDTGVNPAQHQARMAEANGAGADEESPAPAPPDAMSSSAHDQAVLPASSVSGSEPGDASTLSSGPDISPGQGELFTYPSPDTETETDSSASTPPVAAQAGAPTSSSASSSATTVTTDGGPGGGTDAHRTQPPATAQPTGQPTVQPGTATPPGAAQSAHGQSADVQPSPGSVASGPVREGGGPRVEQGAASSAGPVSSAGAGESASGSRRAGGSSDQNISGSADPGVSGDGSNESGQGR